MRLVWLFCLPLLMAGCREKLEFTEPIPIDQTFIRIIADPEDVIRYQAGADYAQARAGLAVFILEHDQVVFEDYHNGYDGQTPVHIYSGTKSFSGVLAGMLLSRGQMSLDEKAVDYLPEFLGNSRKEAITLEHLLHFTSGLADDDRNLTLDGLYVDQKIEDKYAYALSLPTESDPGSRYEYSSTHLMVFGAVLTHKLGEDPLSWLERELFTPLTFRYSGWHTDPAGNPMLPYGCWTTANEWAKLGVMLKNRGQWEGEALLTPGIVALLFQGSEAMPGYGLTFWLNVPAPDGLPESADSPLDSPDGPQGLIWNEGPSDLAMAAGYEDNRLYLLPSKDMVIVRLGSGDDDWSDGDFLRAIFPDG